MSRYPTQGYDWEIPPLDSHDQRLVDAYSEVARPLDDLPYTDDFDRLCEILGINETKEDRHRIYKRLMNLRKSGRLPRAGRHSSSASSSLGLDES